jgi:uncharacterized membrane protein
MGAAAHREDDQTIDWGLSVKRVAIVLAFLVTIATLLTHEAYVLRTADPMWTHLAPFRWWLLPHVAGGMIALAIAPLQASSTLRRRAPRLHRILGRIYVGASLVSACLSIFIVIRFQVQANWWVMGTMGALWFLTTLFAWFAALNRDFVHHRLWMGRSFGFTYTFVLTRIVPDSLMPGLDYEKMTALYWGFIVASLIIPDLIVNGRALVPVRLRGQWRRTRDDRASRAAPALQPSAASPSF